MVSHSSQFVPWYATTRGGARPLLQPIIHVAMDGAHRRRRLMLMKWSHASRVIAVVLTSTGGDLEHEPITIQRPSGSRVDSPSQPHKCYIRVRHAFIRARFYVRDCIQRKTDGDKYAGFWEGTTQREAETYATTAYAPASCLAYRAAALRPDG